MGIKVILFDFGGVIWTPLEEKVVQTNRERLAQSLGFENAALMWRYFYGGEAWQLTKIGRQTEAQMWSSLLEPLGISSMTKQQAFVHELFDGVGIKPEMEMVLTRLAARYSLGILSNASDTLETLIYDQLGIGSIFTSIVNSYHIGVAKPDRRSFAVALDRLGAVATEVFFVDDQARNTDAAEVLGIGSHVFTNIQSLINDMRTKGLWPG